jgi:hypothetical protein
VANFIPESVANFDRNRWPSCPGIRRKSIDLTTKKLRVAHSLWKKQLVSPKTIASARSIPLSEVLVSALAAHHESSAFREGDDFVFCTSQGEPLNPDMLRKDVLYSNPAKFSPFADFYKLR